MLGDLLESVDIYVSFSGTMKGIITENMLLAFVPFSLFEKNSINRLPRYTFGTNASDVLMLLEIDTQEVFPEDVFEFSWTVHLEDGRSFNSQNTGLNVESQPFFRPPYIHKLVVDCND